MRAADAGFEHAAMPDRNATLTTQVVDASRRGDAAHRPGLMLMLRQLPSSIAMRA